MSHFKIFTEKQLSQITNYRSGEIKFGEKIITVPVDENIEDFLKNSDQKFVIFGINEDIGIKANLGRQGAKSAFENTLKSLVNIQHNKFCKGSNVIVLGSLCFNDEYEAIKDLNLKNKIDKNSLHKIVELIDKEVSHWVHVILKCNKIPIIIGGGHNNAYGNIKGLALAKGKPVNAINFDAHTDFRILEGRHSGNGFSYAYEEGFLKKYFIFGVHENYISKGVHNTIKDIENRVQFVSYEEIDVYKSKNYLEEMEKAYSFIKNEAFGIELDLDAIPNIYSSAMTPSGFSVQQAREFVYYFGKQKNASYLHICEGAPELDTSENNHLTGKLITYLITDFIKSKIA